MAANNETGVIQPIAEISRLAREAGALLLVDAVTAAGKMDLDFSLCDYMTLSAHKLGGPQGSGALIVRDGAPFAPQLVGGGQQKGLRAGTGKSFRHCRLRRGGESGAGMTAKNAPALPPSATISKKSAQIGHPRCGDLRRGSSAPVQHLQYRPAGPVRRKYRHRARSGRRAGLLRFLLFLRQDHAVACACPRWAWMKIWRARRCASVSAGIPLDDADAVVASLARLNSRVQTRAA